MKKDNILIVGTGALATLFAARLSSIGINITMLGSWAEGLDALNKHGARLDNSAPILAFPLKWKGQILPLQGGVREGRVNAVRKCKKALYAIVLVKSWQTERTARQLGECLAKDGVVLTLQNGLGNGEILTEALGAERVAQGVTVVGASLLAPGIVRISGDARVSVEAHPRLGPLNILLTEAGLELKSVPDVQSLIWSKLVINAAINPLTALLDVPNGELLKRPSARALMGELALEAAAVASVQGIQLSFDNPVAAAEDVAHRTSSNISSMLQDLRRGAPTEIEAICGAISRAGERHHIPTPANRVCWQLVKARTEGL